jgi:hypothetical protein
MQHQIAHLSVLAVGLVPPDPREGLTVHRRVAPDHAWLQLLLQQLAVATLGLLPVPVCVLLLAGLVHALLGLNLQFAWSLLRYQPHQLGTQCVVPVTA